MPAFISSPSPSDRPFMNVQKIYQPSGIATIPTGLTNRQIKPNFK